LIGRDAKKIGTFEAKRLFTSMLACFSSTIFKQLNAPTRLGSAVERKSNDSAALSIQFTAGLQTVENNMGTDGKFGFEVVQVAQVGMFDANLRASLLASFPIFNQLDDPTRLGSADVRRNFNDFAALSIKMVVGLQPLDNDRGANRKFTFEVIQLAKSRDNGLPIARGTALGIFILDYENTLSNLGRTFCRRQFRIPPFITSQNVNSTIVDFGWQLIVCFRNLKCLSNIRAASRAGDFWTLAFGDMGPRTLFTHHVTALQTSNLV
jgi:hypothetical protein